MLAGLFDGRQGAVTDWLSSSAGIGSRPASTLMALAAPAVLNLLGSQARQGGSLTSSSLGDYLGGQLGYLRNVVPQSLASALGLTDPSRLGVAAPAAQHAVSTAPVVKESSTAWWRWPALAALALLGVWWFANRAPAGAIDPRVAIANEDGRIVCSARVRDNATRERLLLALRSSFGQSAGCDVTVDPNVKAIAWLPNIDGVVAALKRPGSDFQLDGSAITLGGWMSAADRTATLGELRALLSTDYTLGQADQAAAYIGEAKAKAIAALAAIGSTFSASGFISAMNLSVINFPTGSAEIPADSRDLIARAAEVLRTAPAGTAIEIGGHTDNVGDAGANVKLSDARANAVRQALVTAGVNGATVVAKGYGDTRPVASNDTEYGRFRNRRIEYSVMPAASK
jgi:outer membrane protein OmpA-like peptidoglycan-associated protein